MSYLTERSFRGLGADETAPAAQPEPDEFEQTIVRATAAATSWWDAMPEYKRQAIVSGVTGAATFYWMTKIIGGVFGR
jgi:hypothetical protein